MSYKDWLYDQLVEDGVIDEADVDIDEITEEMLLTETELEEMDLQNYQDQFKEHCQAYGETPDWDLD